MRIVLIAPGGIDDLTSLGPTQSHEIAVVSWEGAPSGGVFGIGVAEPEGRFARLSSAVWSRAQRNPLGRTLYRLSPFDHGAAFWRTVRRSTSACEAIRGADLVVAAERDGVFAAWKFSRLVRPHPIAVNGFAAARTVLQGSAA